MHCQPAQSQSDTPDSATALKAAMVISMAMDPPPAKGAAYLSERLTTMSEPASAGIGAALGWKAVGGAAGVAAGGAGLAAVIVMLMTPPRSPREWAVGLITTVLGSVCGGAAVVQRFGLESWLGSYVGLVALMGLAFACGLPAWAIVRWTFTWMIRREGKDIGEVIADAKAVVRP